MEADTFPSLSLVWVGLLAFVGFNNFVLVTTDDGRWTTDEAGRTRAGRGCHFTLFLKVTKSNKI
jgi:hypothetical protein